MSELQVRRRERCSNALAPGDYCVLDDGERCDGCEGDGTRWEVVGVLVQPGDVAFHPYTGQRLYVIEEADDEQ